MSEANAPWRLTTVGYDYRFGVAAVRMEKAGEAAAVEFAFPLASFLRTLGVKPHELRDLLAESNGAAHDMAPDIDGTRRRVLEETDWQGKVVLDVGGYDGFAAEIAHKGGAARAICLDSHQYEHYGWAEVLKPGVEYVRGDGFDWAEPVDVVIAYNVLYHVKDQLGFLAHLRRITKPGGEMLLCTLFRYHDGAWVYFYEPRECNSTDESVFWGPSITALERMLRATGWEFKQEGLAMDRVVYRCRPAGEVAYRQSEH